ncbi:lipoprotein [Qipengyuania sp. MTN3-11]|uniref:lipoprotein n=1 Tax=Qipengyuania sp. MTN3-11 TaxID=3056557 RepID=UPI0036F30953
MRKMLIAAVLAAGLAACSQEAAEPEAEATTAAVPEPAAETAAMAADGQPAPGMYRITTADGMVFNEDVRADGTYVQTDEAGEVVETGRWVQKSPEQYCYTVDEQYLDEDTPAGERCNTEGIDAEGVWTSTNPDGETSTVERVTA